MIFFGLWYWDSGGSRVARQVCSLTLDDFAPAVSTLFTSVTAALELALDDYAPAIPSLFTSAAAALSLSDDALDTVNLVDQ